MTRDPVRMVECRPGERQPIHHHVDARLILFLRGEMIEDTFVATGRFVRGDVLFRPPYFGHANRAGEDGSAYVRLPISPSAVRAWVAERGWRAWHGRLSIGAVKLRTLMDAPFGGDAVLPWLTREAYRRDGISSEAFRDIVRVLTEDNDRIEDLSRRLGLRPYEFSRQFSAAMGVSPRTFRTRARLQRALELLAHSSSPLAQVAATAAYCDQSHLSRSVKRETGLTPVEFRAIASGRR